MLHKAPEFKYHELPQLDELELELPNYAENTKLLAELALKNIMLIQQTLGPSIMTERVLPTRTIRQLDTIRLSRSEDRFAVSAISQHTRLGKPTSAVVRHYLYYADPTLAHLAQLDIALPSPTPGKGRLLKNLGSMNMQRFMTPADHLAAEELIVKVRG